VKYPHARLLVFSKAPVPGQVKTRLIPLLGAAGAASLYAGMLDATLDKAVAAGLCPVELWCAPDRRHTHFAHARAQYALRLRQQPAGDLGRRMSQAFCSVLQEARHAVLVGADCPDLSAGDLDAAFAALAAGTDVVLGPATDGGYYLIGMSAHRPCLFEDIAWGSAQVLDATLDRCRRHHLRWFCLAEHADVDTPGDLPTGAGTKPAGGPSAAANKSRTE
jgi:hypothetical protein